MTEEWVRAVWEAVVTADVSEHVSATDNRFLPYLCQPLHGLVVCVSQADQPTKIALKKLIENNGEGGGGKDGEDKGERDKRRWRRNMITNK